jgi:hypothetical protein
MVMWLAEEYALHGSNGTPQIWLSRDGEQTMSLCVGGDMLGLDRQMSHEHINAHAAASCDGCSRSHAQILVPRKTRNHWHVAKACLFNAKNSREMFNQNVLMRRDGHLKSNRLQCSLIKQCDNARDPRINRSLNDDDMSRYTSVGCVGQRCDKLEFKLLA